MVWVQFVACLLLIIGAGSQLSKCADLIAEKTGLGRAWIGIVLLAAITSLPELATGISSVAFIGKPDLAIGDLFGSNLINLLIIAVIDIVHRRGPVLHLLGTNIVLASILSVLLITTAATSIYLAGNGLTAGIFGLIGISSLVLLSLYFLAQYMLFRFQSLRANAEPRVETLSRADVTLKRLVLRSSIAAMATVGAGIWLANIGNEIAEITGLKASLVGTLFLAACTSAPEIVVAISAARLGALDMAVGNMVGSNLFNMGVIIFIDDLFYGRGSILADVSSGHILAALFSLLMSSVVIIGIVFKPKSWPRAWVGIDTIAIIALYVGAILTLYLLGQ